MRLGAPWPYLLGCGGWTLGQGREVIKQEVVVNDRLLCTLSIKPPAALCVVWPSPKG